MDKCTWLRIRVMGRDVVEIKHGTYPACQIDPYQGTRTKMIVGIVVLVVVCYVVYLIASAESRREKAIVGRVRSMIAQGQSHTLFAGLYFDAARKYASEKGGRANEADVASVYMLIDGRRWDVMFFRDIGSNRTRITIEDAQKVQRQVEKFAEGRSNNPIGSNNTRATINGAQKAQRQDENFGQGQSDNPSAERDALYDFAKAWFAAIDAAPAGVRQKLLKRPSWIVNEEITTAFVDGVTKQCMQAGIPEQYLMTCYCQDDLAARMFGCAAAAEHLGHDRQIQCAVAASVIKLIWNSLSDSTKEAARNISLDNVTPESLRQYMNS